jgi:opacity protein-like surface antigen
MKSAWFAASSLALIASSVSAQSISIALRGTGSVPTGSFAETQTTSSSQNTALIEGAKNGFGYGLDVAIGLGPIAAYAGFDHVKFDCETSTCKTDGKYTLEGATVGVKLAIPLASRFRPYVRGGVTFHDLAGGYGGSNANVLTTERTPGYEIGGGFDYALLSIISLTPQVRYVGHNFKAKIPGVITPTTANDQGANYLSFDLGLSVNTPFSGKKK